MLYEVFSNFQLITHHIDEEIVIDLIIIEVLCLVDVEPGVDVDGLGLLVNVVHVVPLIIHHGVTLSSDQVDAILTNWGLK